MKYPVLWATSALIAAVAVSGFAVARQARGAPGVTLARDVVAAASAFETYTRGAGTISAAFENGVLSVTVPKPEQPKPRRIEISGEPKASQTIDAREPEHAAH
jgi:hypothetical protein